MESSLPFDLTAAPAIPLTSQTFKPVVDPGSLLSLNAANVFAGARSPQGALTAAALRLQCWDAAHNVAQDLETPEGSYWHGILHRIEPDAFNAGYWFRRVGRHPIFSSLRSQAKPILESHWRVPAEWQPEQFIQWCTSVKSDAEREALEAVQMLEWQLLYDYCRSPRK